MSLFIRNLFFFILQPGIVAGLVPLWILGNDFISGIESPARLNNYAGGIIFLAGLIILISCIVSFAVKGRGTLSPADPTKKLVVTGLYKFSRNPMYLGVILLLAGEAVFFASTDLFIYAIILFAVFNVYIILFEEPRLRKDFEMEYHKYSRKVRRWL